jgi:hypothetical protein
MTYKSQEWQSVYIGIMQEIVLRSRVIETLFSDDVKLGIRPRFEFCHLELRMICELLAISSLVAHGDIPAAQSKRIESIWQADRLLRTMAHLHPDFFPAAMKLVRDERGKITLVDNHDGIVTRDQVIALYNDCGKVLHRGNLKTFGHQETEKTEYLEAHKWGRRLKALASGHAIAAYGPGDLVLWYVTIADDEALSPKILRLRRLAVQAERERPTAPPDTGRSETANPGDDGGSPT